MAYPYKNTSLIDKSKRYPNGYTPKIEYYQAQLSMAVDSKDLDQIKYFTKKLEWFMDRQAKLTKS